MKFKGTVSGDNPTPVPLDRRTVTVLFADVVGSTTLIEGMDAERAMSMLAPAVNAMAQAVERYGGTVNARMGDGLMALFGVPLMLEDHAVRASLAAVAMVADIRCLAEHTGNHLRIRVGVNSGPVVVSVISDGEHADYGVAGPTVHAAARFEKLAQPDTIYISESVYRQVGHVFDCEFLGPRELKGFAEAQPVYQLKIEREDDSLPRPLSYNIAAPLTGRSEQRAWLHEILTRLNRGQGGVALIVGEPGLGKTRLLHETRLGFPETNTWLQGRGRSFSQRVSYGPFTEMLKAWLGLDAGMDEGQSWRILEGAIDRQFSHDAADIVPYLGVLIGMEVPERHRERVRYLDGESLNRQVLGAARRFLERLADQHPVVIAIDDVHWIDGSSVVLLEHILPLAATVPILFCLLSRPEHEVLARVRKVALREIPDRLQELVLAPLSVQESQELLRQLIGSDLRSRRMRDLVLSKAEGNPFFLEEIVRTLIDTGVLVRDSVSGIWSTRDGTITIPDTTQGAVMARVDRLDVRLKELLRIASVIGRTFPYHVLRAVIGADEDDLSMRLASLVAIELIEEARGASERVFRFRHALGHEAIYASLLLDERRKLHEKVAQCLSNLYAERPQEAARLLAFHYARAEKRDLALSHMLEAAEQSHRMGAGAEELLYYEEAIDTYARVFGEHWDKAQQAMIESRLGELYARSGDHAAALNHFTRALSALGESLPKSRLRAYMAMARELARHMWHKILPHHGTRTHRGNEAKETSPQLALVNIYHHLAEVFYFENDSLGMLLVALRCHRAAERLMQPSKLSIALGMLQLIASVIPIHTLANWYGRHALALTAGGDDVSAQIWALEASGMYSSGIGRWHRAESSLSEAVRLSNQIGDWRRWIECMSVLSETKHYQGQFAQRLLLADEVYNKSVTTADLQGQIWGLLDKVETLSLLGEWRQCDTLLSKLSRIMKWELPPADKIWHLGLRSLVRFKLGQVNEGIDFAVDAVALMEDTPPTAMYTMEGYAATAQTLLLASTSTAEHVDNTVISGNLKRAMTNLRNYARVFPIARPRLQLLRAKLALAQGSHRRAARHLEVGLRLAERLGMSHEVTLLQQQREGARSGGLAAPVDQMVDSS